MKKMFADLHCHPALFGFNRLRNQSTEDDPDQFHAWNVPDAVDHQSMAEGKRGATYTQCTMPMLVASKTRLAFASITPIEKGFFVGSTDPDKEHRFEVEALRLLSGASLLSTTRHLIAGRRREAGAEVTKILKNRGPLRRALQRAFMRYDMPRIRFLGSEEFDYFEEFLREYEFYTNADGQRRRGSVPRPDGTKVEVEGTYHMIRDAEHLRHVVEETDDVALVMSIEGAHTFSMNPQEQPYDYPQLREHLEILRDLPHPFLFITLAHHFDNGLCGHAHSLPDAANWVMDQQHRLHEGFTEKGRWMVHELLDLDENLRPRGGRRFLLDVKHMSPLSRKQYYEEFVRPYNEWARGAGERLIPVIASHTGYSGVATLDELIANADREDDNWHKNPYLAWGINHCDQDVRVIWQSEGLLGICFDQRICGVSPRQTVPPEGWIAILMRQILGTVDVVLQDETIPYEDRLSVWNCVCIGSDFDGLIDPVTSYPTTMEFSSFADDLSSALQAIAHTRGIASIGVENLVEKICWRNGYEFALRNL